MDHVCGNCLCMKSYNCLFDFGFCRRYDELRLFSSKCDKFKSEYSLDELKRIEERRRSN